MKIRRAFTLLEMLVVLAVIAILFSMALPGIIAQLRDGQVRGEDAILNAMQQDVWRSFDSEDFQNINIAAVAGEIPGTVNPTNFYGNPDATFSSMSAPDWFAKLATVRGTSYTAAAPAAQPAIKAILYNSFNRARLLVAAPPEANQQRFMIISLMARQEQLVMPANDGSLAWFDAIWTTEWNTRSGALPAYWTSHLSAAQAAAWMGNSSTGTNLFLLRVVKITLPRYTLSISNSHPTANGYIYYNENAGLVTSNANSGVTVSPAILAGRVIKVYKGADPVSAAFSYRFTIRENTDVFIQTSN